MSSPTAHKGLLVGYARTSTAEQEAGLQAQVRDLREAGCTSLFAGVVALTAEARRLVPGDGDGALYSTVPPGSRDAALTALPYHLWANREPGSMQVWIAETAQ